MHREIAELRVCTGVSREANDRPLPEVADRFYKPNEWKRLVAAGLHEEVIKLRRKRNLDEKGDRIVKKKTEQEE